jgi:hypothetical protein
MRSYGNSAFRGRARAGRGRGDCGNRWAVVSRKHKVVGTALLLLAIIAETAAAPRDSAPAQTAVTACVESPAAPVGTLVPSGGLTLTECVHSLAMQAAVGERESASISIRVSTDLTGLVIRVSARNTAGLQFPPDLFDIRIVKTWFQADGAWRQVRIAGNEPVAVPELLLKNDDLVVVDLSKKTNYLRDVSGRLVSAKALSGNVGVGGSLRADQRIADSNDLRPFDVKADVPRYIWLTVSVPEGARPDVYTGEVVVSSRDGLVLMSMPLRLEILPFTLEESPLEYAIYYRGVLGKGTRRLGSENKSKDQMTRELINMRDHGVSNPTIYQDISDISGLNDVLTLRRDVGISNKRLFLLGTNVDNETLRRERRNGAVLKTQVEGWRRQFGVEQVFIYGRDEAEPREILAQLPRIDSIRESGIGVFSAAYLYRYAESEYAGRLSVLVLGTRPDRSVIARFQRAGTRVYLYNQPQVGIEDPSRYRYTYGIGAYLNGYDGVMPYAYQHGMGNIWDDEDHDRFRDHVFAYPTDAGVIDTVAWEAFREAVDDVRYLVTYERLRKVTTNSSPPLATPTATNELDAWRRTVAREIQRLCAQGEDRSARCL